MAEKQLPSNPTITEMFEYFDMPEGNTRVAPVTIKDDPADTQLLILVRGDQLTASAIFAALWERLEELSAIDKQQDANDGSSIITS